MEPAEAVSPAPRMLSGPGPVETAFVLFFVLAIGFPLIAFFKNVILNFSSFSLTLDFFRIVANSVWFTLIEAVASTVVTAVIGLAVGVWLSKGWAQLPNVLRAALRGLGFFNFVIPGVVMASLVIGLARQLGFSDQGYLPLVLAHAFANALFFATFVADRTSRFYAGEGQVLHDAARLFGAPSHFRARINYFGAWREVLRFFCPLVFLWSASSFATVLILGGGPARATPDVLLFYSLQQDPSLSRVFCLLFVQVGLGFALYRFGLAPASAARGSTELNVYGTSTQQAHDRPTAIAPRRVIAAVTVFLVFVLPLVGLIVQTVQSIAQRPIDDDVWPATAASVLVALSAAGLVSLFWYVLLQVRSQLRWTMVLGCGFSTTVLAALWSQLGLEPLLSGRPLLQLLTLALAITVAFLPLLALWIQLRVDSIPTRQIEAALVLGCPPDLISRRVILPQATDILARSIGFIMLGAIGELAFAGLFVFDAPLLSTLSKTMAARYNFTGASMLIFVTGIATLVLVLAQNFTLKRPRA